MPNDIPLELITSALKLTGKTMADMNEIVHGGDYGYINEFSIEKFCYYLYDDTFLEKYIEIYRNSNPMPQRIAKHYKPGVMMKISNAIYHNQKGNPEPLISLLSKI